MCSPAYLDVMTIATERLGSLSQQAHASSPKFKPFTSLHRLPWDDELISNNATNNMNSGICETNHKLYSPFTVDRTKLPELKTEQEARSHEHPIANW
ncbi:hypothetical protein I7I50_06377 [Histoplasma capsulatum G186AR]|uniref:Uncharacterized protein n=1 Tax=Ajellomyces capsulatus TaxID=5037 RepID=A0A8H7YZG7_AJECA|nr:hypothetical protein I7I52_10550 [Histoplasma capsulatum]QSS67335.1 hypothetical protein I7I50_06377 [Histoplasma capsulatum G186AR]